MNTYRNTREAQSPFPPRANSAPASWSAAALCRLSLLPLLGVLLISPPAVRAAATPPEFMTYQGFLVDANGNTLAPTTPQNYPVIFRVYTAASGGTLVWSEQQIVTVDKGNFSVLLGEGTPLGAEPRPILSSVFAGATASDRYISAWVTIGGSTTEILPRLRLVPSPYSFLATSANNLVQPNGTPVVSYAGGQVSISGNLSASGTITGNGAGLTGLTASQIPTLDAAKISTGIFSEARVPGSLSGNRIFTGNVGIGAASPLDRLQIGDFEAANGYVSIKTGGGNQYQAGLKFRHFDETIGFDLVDNEAAPNGLSFIRYPSGAPVSTMFLDRFSGNVGIGTTTPTARLSVNGGVAVSGAIAVSGTNTLEFGAGVAGKEFNAGKIGYQTFTPGSLDIVGAGNTAANRKVKIWAEGGATFTGNVGIGTASPQQMLHLVRDTNPGITLQNSGSSFTIVNETCCDGLLFQKSGSAGYFKINGNGTTSTSSDARLKKNVLPLNDVLRRVSQLRPVSYQMKDELDSGPRHLGFIAQEVEPLFPELVSNTGEFKGISYPEFAPVAIAALQELSAQTKSLRTENEALKQQLAARDFKELARDERLAALEGLVKKLAQAGGNDRRAENIAPAKAAQEPGASGATTFAADR